MFKKTVQPFKKQQALFYYRERAVHFDVFSIHKHSGENDYTAWFVEVPKKELNLEQIEHSLIQLIFYNADYENEGYSVRSSLEDLALEFKDLIPTLESDVQDVASKLLVS